MSEERYPPNPHYPGTDEYYFNRANNHPQSVYSPYGSPPQEMHPVVSQQLPHPVNIQGHEDLRYQYESNGDYTHRHFSFPSPSHHQDGEKHYNLLLRH